MPLSQKELELVAMGASIGGNCIPCFECRCEKRREFGLTKKQLAQVIAVA
ncbi:MAG: carboxymuconolactone decarboxylase family protein [Planctomycetaceae bacterium]|nr:carboxymuconolactone decarboxylase family protein [Planctomycetaceae bacterium]